MRVCCADGRRSGAFGFCVGVLATTWWCDLDGATLPLIILLKQKHVRIQHVRNLLQKKSIPRCSGVNAAERIKLGSQLTKPATRIIDCRWFHFQPTKDTKGCYCTGFVYILLIIKIYQDFPHLAITVSMWIWNDGTVIFLWRFSMDRGIGISHKNAVKQRSFWEFVWWIELASIEIQFWSTEFLEKPPTSLWPPFFSKPWHGYWKGEATIFHGFSLCESEESTWICVDSDVRFWMKRWKMSSGTPCRIELCTVYIPKRRRGSLQTCFILDILWYFLKLFSDFSVKNNWIPIKVLGLRFADLVLCPAFALQSLCRVLKLHKRTDGLELGIWKNSGDLGWTSVLISDIQRLCAWISGDWPWLAHGNHIRYHGNGSDLTSPNADFNSRVWKLWTTVSEEVRPVGQEDLCNTYKL